MPAPHSIYKGIRKLPPAHYLKLSPGSDGRESTASYWSMRAAAEEGSARPLEVSEEEAVEGLDRLLRDAVRLRTVADVPVGVFLSGGVDSSTVAALMQAQASGPVKSFSIGFREERYNEAAYAKAVAKHLGTDHTELYVTADEAMSVIPSLAQWYDEPFADSSQIPTLLVSRLARRNVTVALSGDGGDELFCGYVRYAWGRDIWKRISRVPFAMRSVAATALRAVSQHSWNRFLGSVNPLMSSVTGHEITGGRLHKLAEVLALRTPELFYQGLASCWQQPESVVLESRETVTAVSDPEQWAALKDFTMHMMYLDAVTYLPDDILVKVDRASMAVSLEVRVPFLDHRAVEYAWRVPLSMKMRDGESKWLLRQVLYRYVPRELIDRPKMGFGVPIDVWLRGPLRDWAESLLSEQRLREEGYFDPAPIRDKWIEHVSGRRDWQYLLWPILIFQSWREQAAQTLSHADLRIGG